MTLVLSIVWNGIAVYVTDTGLVFSLTQHLGLVLKKKRTNALGCRNRKYCTRHYEKIAIGSDRLKIQGVQYCKHYYVHRLVAMAFLGPPPFPKAQVDHINRDRWDNRPSNLRWVTAHEQHMNSRPHLERIARLQSLQNS